MKSVSPSDAISSAESSTARHVIPMLVRCAIACLLLGAASGCARYVPTARLDLVELGAEGILQRAAEQAGSVSSLLSTGTLQVRTDRGGLTARCAVLYAEPDSIRLEVSAALGITVIQAVVAGADIQVYIPSERTVVEGTIRSGEMLEIGGIPLELDTLRELVLGPAIARDWVGLAARVDRLDISPTRIILGTTQPDGSRLLLTLGTDLYYQRVDVIDSGGRIVQESHFADYRRIRRAHLPRVVRVVYPDRYLELTFKATRQNARPGRKPSDFVLGLPADVRRLPLLPPPSRP